MILKFLLMLLLLGMMVARNKLMNKISDFQYAIGVTLASDDGNHIQADTQFGFVYILAPWYHTVKFLL